MNVVERNNIKIFGQGKKALVFAHGYGCSQTVWRHMIRAFQDEYQLILFDHVGSGKSNLSVYDRTKYGTLSGYAEDLIEICRSLEIEQSIYVGHSVSAMIGVLAAIQDPSLFERLVLVTPSPSYINERGYVGGFEREVIDSLMRALEKDYDAWTRQMAPIIMGNTDRPELSEELMQNFCRVKPEIAKHFGQVTFLSDHRNDLSKLDTPSLILQCTQDVIAPEEVGRYLQKSLKNSELRVLKATGHCPHLSAPQELISVMKDYLRCDVRPKKSEIKSAA